LSEIDYTLNLIIEKLIVSKLDNSFLLSFSFLSVLFSLSNLILADLLYREILTVGAILYFLFSFYIGYFRGVLRDNWGFRIWGWLWMALSTAVITATLFILLISQSGIRISPTFAYGVFLIFGSIASILLVNFLKDICAVTPTLRNHLISIPPIHRRYLSPFVDPAINRRPSKPTYLALSVLLIIGLLLTMLSLVG
jgi:hypothetical protein